MINNIPEGLEPLSSDEFFENIFCLFSNKEFLTLEEKEELVNTLKVTQFLLDKTISQLEDHLNRIKE